MAAAVSTARVGVANRVSSYEIFAYTTRGRRIKQEDVFVIKVGNDVVNKCSSADSEVAVETAYVPPFSDNNIVCAAIFDGHNSANVPMWFANQVPDVTMRLLHECKQTSVRNIAQSIARPTRDAFIELDNQSHSLFPSGGTTSCSLYLCREWNGVIAVNVGDSRAVCVGDLPSRDHVLTRDHTPDLPQERKRIEMRGGIVEHRERNVPRINGLAMSRSLGDSFFKQQGHVIPDPTLTAHEMNNPGHALAVVVASDGVWNVLSNSEVCDIVRDYVGKMKLYRRRTSEHGDPRLRRSAIPDTPARMIVDRAYEQGIVDNITAMVVMIHVDGDGTSTSALPYLVTASPRVTESPLHPLTRSYDLDKKTRSPSDSDVNKRPVSSAPPRHRSSSAASVSNISRLSQESYRKSDSFLPPL